MGAIAHQPTGCATGFNNAVLLLMKLRTWFGRNFITNTLKTFPDYNAKIFA